MRCFPWIRPGWSPEPPPGCPKIPSTLPMADWWSPPIPDCYHLCSQHYAAPATLVDLSVILPEAKMSVVGVKCWPSPVDPSTTPASLGTSRRLLLRPHSGQSLAPEHLHCHDVPAAQQQAGNRFHRSHQGLWDGCSMAASRPDVHS